MSHRYLTRDGYILIKKYLTKQQLQKIRKDLTVTPRVLAAFKEFARPKPYKVYLEGPDKIYLPRYYGIKHFGEPLNSHITQGDDIRIRHHINLRPHQHTAAKKLEVQFAKGEGGVLSLPCGYGKTVLAIWSIAELGKKTLVVVNKEFLMDQWLDSIEKFSNARTGILQQDKIEVEGNDIVVAMLHSLCLKDYPPDLFDQFGCVIFDECFPSNTKIVTDQGNIEIGALHKMWKEGKPLPQVKSFNEQTKSFEYKKLTYAWEKKTRQLVQIKLSRGNIECTPNHKFLTTEGYKRAIELTNGDLLISNSESEGYGIIGVINIELLEVTQKSTDVYDIEVEDNHNFIVLSRNKLDSDNAVGPVVHNCHHIASEMFSKALPKVASKFMLGLSATPERKDGLSRVFYHYLGDLFHTERRQGTNTVIVKQIEIMSSSPYFQDLFLSNGTKNTTGMISQLAEFPERNQLIVFLIGLLLQQKRTILVLSSRREHLEGIYQELQQANFRKPDGNFATFGLYYGKQKMNKKNYKKMLEESAKCDVVLGTCQLAQEGLDIPTLNTLLFATPMTDIIQAVGRILRKFHKDLNPMVVDIVDKFGNFPKHASLRRKFYKDEEYVTEKDKILLYDNPGSNQYEDQLRSYLNSVPNIPNKTKNTKTTNIPLRVGPVGPVGPGGPVGPVGPGGPVLRGDQSDDEEDNEVYNPLKGFPQGCLINSSNDQSEKAKIGSPAPAAAPAPITPVPTAEKKIPIKIQLRPQPLVKPRKVSAIPEPNPHRIRVGSIPTTVIKSSSNLTNPRPQTIRPDVTASTTSTTTRSQLRDNIPKKTRVSRRFF